MKRSDRAMLQRHSVTPSDIGLIMADLESEGWTRQKRGKGFSYLDPKGRPMNGHKRDRCEALAIPPAWRNVWISPVTDTHILALGEDAAGRRQYIYHPDWREAREHAKFADLPRFADGLPRLRRRVSNMLKAEDGDDLVLGSVIRLLDEGGLRVGHPRPDAENPALGATTLSPHNVQTRAGRLILTYTAKGGKTRDVELNDEELAQAMEALTQQAEEEDGFLFETSQGRCSAQRVNNFLRDVMGEDFSAKDFRTWGGTVAAARVLRRQEAPSIKAMSEAAADWLGNTPSIARNSYIHPAIIEAREVDLSALEPAGPTRLRVDERFCYAVIQTV